MVKGYGVTENDIDFFEEVISKENGDFFGYHSSTQCFRVFQDIIRVVLEEKCGISIRDDFHFVRIPGDPLLCCNNVANFFSYYDDIDDRFSPFQEQLISLNLALYGNYNIKQECSAVYFSSKRSSSEIDYCTKLEPLFRAIGAPISAIEQLFQIGSPLFERDNAVLLQWFGNSEDLNMIGYVSTLRGKRLMTNIAISKLIDDRSDMVLEEQIRLLINISITLNPSSSLVVKRYDMLEERIIDDYESELRLAIAALPYDPEFAGIYRQQLMRFWE